MRIAALTWLWTAAASAAEAAMTSIAPTRSAYSENVFENEVDTSSSTPGRTSSSSPAASSRSPSPKPW